MISANYFIGDSSGYALGTGGLIFIGIYVLALIGIGWIGFGIVRYVYFQYFI